MKRLILAAAAALCVGASAASAADWPTKQQPVYAPDRGQQAVYTWTGFYFGGGVGGDSAKGVTTNSLGIVDPNPPDWKGWSATAFAGTRYQIGSWVLGTELSGNYSWGKFSTTTDLCGGACGPGFTMTDSLSNPWLALGEVQLGYAFGRTLVYASGGVAAGQVKLENTTSLGGWGSSQQTDKTNDFGWTVGAGVDYAFADNFFVGLKYNYVRLNVHDMTSSSTGPFGTFALDEHTRLDEHKATVRIGFKY